MPKTNTVKQSFNAGELSPLMDSRIDQTKYVAGCRILENFIPLIYGGVQRRPGTEYIATQNSSSAKGRAVAFEHSVDDTYILLFENQLVRVFRSGARVTGTATNITAFADYSGTVSGTVKVTSASHGLITGDMVTIAGTTSYNGDFSATKIDANNFYITDTWVADDATGTAAWSGITTPYLTADLFDLDIKQSADVMYIAHDDYEPRKLARTGHTSWTLDETDFQDGPFRPQNTDTSKTMKVDEIAGGGIAAGASVTLTAEGSGNTPFVSGTTAGHLPSGALATSKSKTGALFKLVYGIEQGNVGTSYISGLLDPTGLNNTGTLTIYKGVTWDLVTNGTWGQAADSATIVLERSYDAGTTYETVVSFTSAANYNIETSGTENSEDAIYRLRVTEVTAGGSSCAYHLSVRDENHIGIVEITGVTSTTVATATVLTSLGLATDTLVKATYRWSEGAWSNYRGWPRTVDISPEERLTFGGSSAEPLTVWGSVIGDYTSFKEGSLDDDAIVFTLIGSGQQNTIQWMLPKTAMMIGTVGGEHLLGASKDDEVLTPTNVNAKLQTTYGSEKVPPLLVNQAMLFLQRDRKKVRELLYDYESDSHKADDLTVFSNHITKSGIVDMAFQRTPDPMLWCVRDDGKIALLVYERDQNVFSWCRIVTDGEFESVAVIYGGAGNEDEVWVTVKREIDGSTARYLERFKPFKFDQMDEIMMVDSAVVVESDYDSQNINLGSDTVRYGNGVYGSSFYGGNYGISSASADLR